MNKPMKKEVKRKYIKDNLTGFMFWEYYKGSESDYDYNRAFDKWEKYFNYLLTLIPSDRNIDKFPSKDYAIAYYQGKFDILMDLIREDK